MTTACATNQFCLAVFCVGFWRTDLHLTRPQKGLHCHINSSHGSKAIKAGKASEKEKLPEWKGARGARDLKSGCFHRPRRNRAAPFTLIRVLSLSDLEGCQMIPLTHGSWGPLSSPFTDTLHSMSLLP